MIHLTIQQLSSFLDGDISAANVEIAREHFAACASCTSKLDRLSKLDAALAAALTCAADDSYFEGFPTELDERLRAEEARAAQEVKAAAEKAAPAGTTAMGVAAVGGAAAVRATQPHVLGDERPAPRIHVTREPQRREIVTLRQKPGWSAPSPGVAALTIVAIAGTVGALTFGKELVSRVLHAPRRDAGARLNAAMAADPEVGFAPRAGASASVPPQLAGMSGATKPDAPTDGRDNGIWQADSGDDLDPVDEPPFGADGESTTARYEEDAAQLERSLSILEGDEYKRARFRVAEARYHAWRLEPGKERAVKAAGAIRAFLVGSAPGPERERAVRWLSKVSEVRY